jgi:hypothetical protein
MYMVVDGTSLASLVNDDGASSVQMTFPKLHQILDRLGI